VTDEKLKARPLKNRPKYKGIFRHILKARYIYVSLGEKNAAEGI